MAAASSILLKARSKILIASLATVIGLAVCELGLVLAGASLNDPPLYPGDRKGVHDNTWDPLIGWKLPADAILHETTEDYTVSYRSSLLGFRNQRQEVEAESDHQIVFLGDSFTFGSGVTEEQTFVRLVEGQLPGTRCHNLGIGGFGIDQMWMTLRHYGLPLHPELVILAFIRPDLDRGLTAYRFGHGVWLEKPTFRLTGERLVPLNEDNRLSAVWRFIEQESRLWGLVRKARRSISNRYALGSRWRLNRALFEAIRDECRSAGAPLVVVHLPVNRRPPVPGFGREFARMEVPFLDLTPLLPDDADDLYYPNDRHFNPAGHRVTAKAIVRFLEREGLVPPEWGSPQGVASPTNMGENTTGPRAPIVWLDP
jgi:hypothetical protein